MCHYTFTIVKFLATVQCFPSPLTWKLTFQTNVVVFPPVSRLELQHAPGPLMAPWFPCDIPWFLCGTALSFQLWRTAALGGRDGAWIPITNSHHRPAENRPSEPRAGWWGPRSNGLLAVLQDCHWNIHIRPGAKVEMCSWKTYLALWIVLYCILQCFGVGCINSNASYRVVLQCRNSHGCFGILYTHQNNQLLVVYSCLWCWHSIEAWLSLGTLYIIIFHHPHWASFMVLKFKPSLSHYFKHLWNQLTCSQVALSELWANLHKDTIHGISKMLFKTSFWLLRHLALVRYTA